jgi:transcriptional regulator GlxA family with amidase domain
MRHGPHNKHVTGANAAARVVIVVFDGVKLLDAAGPAEVFAEANRFGANYSLEIASVDGHDVTTSIGTRFAVTRRVSSIDSADTVVVAGGDDLVGRPIDPALVEALKSVPTRARASLSTRQLTRVFQSELGTTPARYVEMVRIDVARAALDAGRTVTDTAQVAGFGSTETLRRVFLNHLGISPKAYRDRFRTTVRS